MATNINNRTYDFSEIKISFATEPGFVLTDPSSINYDNDSQITPQGGLGNKYSTNTIKTGFSTMADITMSYADLDRLNTYAVDNDLRNLPPFMIIIQYVNGDGLTVKNAIEGCSIQNDGRSWDFNSPSVYKNIKLNAVRVNFNYKG